MKAKKSKKSSHKNGSTSPVKNARGQRDIISMFHQQSHGMKKKERSHQAVQDRALICHDALPSTSCRRADKLNMLSLKRRRVCISEDEIPFSEQCDEYSQSMSGSLCAIVHNGDNSEVTTNCVNTENSTDTCFASGGTELSVDASSSEIIDVNCNDEKREKGDTKDLKPRHHSLCLPSDSGAEISEPNTSEISKAGSEVHVHSNSVHPEESGHLEDDKCSLDLAEFPDEDGFEEITGQSVGDQDQTKDEYRVPYYLENFLLIIDTVMKDEYYHSLFDDQDLFHISIFQSLSESCQMLYVRLIQRHHRWLTKHKIQYPKITPDLSPVLTDLICAGLLLDASCMTDLEDVLIALPAPDVKVLAKTLKLTVTSMQKDDLVSAILQHSQRGGISKFFGGKGAGKATSNMIMKRARNLLGSCYKLDSNVRSVFMRIMILFGLHRTRGEDDDAFGGQQQVFQMLMSSLGHIRYPQYTVSRQSKIFKDRASFLRFIAALQIESEMAELLENKNYKKADLLFKKATCDRKELLEERENLEYERILPEYLRAYTAGAVHIRILSLGVELLQYKRQYKEAVQLLDELIGQDVYHVEYRGRWYDRLALNLDHHLKEHGKALDKITLALSDTSVRTGRRLSLYQRADKICHMTCKKRSLLERWTDFEADKYGHVKEAPKAYIQGKRLACGQQGPLYISKEGDNVTLLTRVEDVALAHYKSQGYTEGIHGEGSTFTFLFALCFWDIIFMDDIPDTFYNPYQIYPLDWGSDHFYNSRKAAIDKRLAEIHDASTRKLEKMLQSSWEEHENTLCIGVNWDIFADVDQAKGFVRCLGGSALSGILQRLATNMRYVGGGLPDLAVWNPDKKILKMVEVKGPGDRLSTKQILWLDYLMDLGISAEVCHVQAISTKKLNS